MTELQYKYLLLIFSYIPPVKLIKKVRTSLTSKMNV